MLVHNLAVRDETPSVTFSVVDINLRGRIPPLSRSAAISNPNRVTLRQNFHAPALRTISSVLPFRRFGSGGSSLEESTKLCSRSDNQTRFLEVPRSGSLGRVAQCWCDVFFDSAVFCPRAAAAARLRDGIPGMPSISVILGIPVCSVYPVNQYARYIQYFQYFRYTRYT